MGMSEDLARLDVTEQASMLQAGRVSAVELVEAAIERAERLNPSINAIILPRYEAALAEAKAGSSGPYAGVPMVIKDLGCAIGGEPHYMGTRGYRSIDHRADHDSALYRRFRDAGFVAIGRTNTPEWGCTITTEPLSFGPSRNPWNLDHSTGGSSGGSAAAVSSGIVAAGHAGDGGGSIRIPASECGLVGLKGSRGRVSGAPDTGESWGGFTVDGAVTRTVRDAAAMLDVAAGYEPGDPYSAVPFARPLVDELGVDPGRLRIGFLDHPLLGAAAHPECTAAVRGAAALLESLGHQVEEAWPAAVGDRSFSDAFVQVIATWTAVDIGDLEAALGRPVTGDDIEPDNAGLGALGKMVTGPQYVAAMLEIHRWARTVVRWWNTGGPDGGFDLLVTPTIAAPPPPIGYLSAPGEGARIYEFMQYTAQFNVTGQPAISLPLHMSADGLPVGIQIVAAPNREDVLIQIASQLESAAPWSGRLPPLFG